MEPWLKPGIRTREFAIGMVRPYFGRFVVLMLVGIVASTAGIANAYVVRTLVNTLAEG